jgi:hypothetical protein
MRLTISQLHLSVDLVDLDGVLAGEGFLARGVEVVRAVVLVPCRGKEEGEVDVLLSNIPVTHLFFRTLSSEEGLVAGVG